MGPLEPGFGGLDYGPGVDALAYGLTAVDLVAGGDVEIVEVGSAEGDTRERARLGLVENGIDAAGGVDDLRPRLLVT